MTRDTTTQLPDRPCVLVTETLDASCAAWLAQQAEVIWHPHDGEQLKHCLAKADGLVVRTYTRVDAELLDQAPKLQVIGRGGVGLDNIDLDACRQRAVAVVYTPDANRQAVVEYVLALMLDALRPRTNLFTCKGGDGGVVSVSTDSDFAEVFHEQRKTEIGTQLDQLTLGIVGLGRIGKQLGHVAHAIGMKVVACDLEPETQLRAKVNYPFDFVDHATLYTVSDVVSLHVDGRRQNRHMLNGAALHHLRDHVVLINAARGMLVDHVALADWAGQHLDARIVLDVHDPEPPLLSSPLHRLPNVRMLPHLASRTDRAMKNMSWVVKDVIAVLQSKAPRYPAD